MNCTDFINILAIICSPVIAVFVGRYLQDREKSRNDKMEIFKILMMNRGLGWSYENAKALNIIEIVFADDDNVLKQWKDYYQKLCIQNPNDSDALAINEARDRFLVTMAQSLGYKETITQETIRNAYIPIGLSKSIEQQQQNQKAFTELTTMFLKNHENKESNDGKDAHGNA